MGGRPSKATPADRRLKENRTQPAVQPVKKATPVKKSGTGK